MGLGKDLHKIAERTKKRHAALVTAILFEINRATVLRTPVISGRARGGWIASVGEPLIETPLSLDSSGSGTISKANSTAVGAYGGIYYLVNNVAYIDILEYGGYPAPPEKGSWDKKTQSYEILSRGGYSKQAPAGMVRITVKEVKNKVSQLAAGI